MHSIVLILTLSCTQATDSAAQDPLPQAERLRLRKSFEDTVKQTTARLANEPASTRLLSQRGDAYFFLGKFQLAAKDYDQMVRLDRRQDASHWRRGIAWFYAGEFGKAAGQFERYHSFDNVDRENGIWRYLCQFRARGKQQARQGLLRYRKDDREPFPAVYRLFAGDTTPKEILTGIQTAKISDTERDKRVFYAELYIGLNELVEGRKNSAEQHLAKAIATKWPRTAGYGPNYMWHVARVQFDLLRRERASAGEKPAKSDKPK